MFLPISVSLTLYKITGDKGTNILDLFLINDPSSLVNTKILAGISIMRLYKPCTQNTALLKILGWGIYSTECNGME